MERELLQLKIDMHVHSSYSPDSLITPEELIFYAKKRGLDGVAVTDHDRLDGALKIAAETDFLIIPGIEVRSSEGHIVGLNIAKAVPSKMDATETVNRIHDAGGIAVACHPTGLFKGGLGKRTNTSFDAVEVINSSAIPFNYAVKQNAKIASRLGKPRLAGSDAHYAPEIGCAYTLVNAEHDVNEVVKAIRRGLCQPFGNPIPFKVRLKRIVEVNRRRLHSQPIRHEVTIGEPIAGHLFSLVIFMCQVWADAIIVRSKMQKRQRLNKQVYQIYT